MSFVARVVVSSAIWLVIPKASTATDYKIHLKQFPAKAFTQVSLGNSTATAAGPVDAVEKSLHKNKRIKVRKVEPR